MSIAESLRRLRKASGLTQQKLAEKAGVSMIVVTKIEQGTTRDPAMSSLIKLADVFEVSIDELIDRKFPKSSKK
jgi:transcriptional regulator with XRE-family HTH domain